MLNQASVAIILSSFPFFAQSKGITHAYSRMKEFIHPTPPPTVQQICYDHRDTLIIMGTFILLLIGLVTWLWFDRTNRKYLQQQLTKQLKDLQIKVKDANIPGRATETVQQAKEFAQKKWEQHAPEALKGKEKENKPEQEQLALPREKEPLQMQPTEKLSPAQSTEKLSPAQHWQKEVRPGLEKEMERTYGVTGSTKKEKH